MKMNLIDYVIKFDGQFGSEICDTAIRECEEKNDWHQHQYNDPHTGISVDLNGDRELDISGCDFSVKPVMMYLIWDALKKYTTQLNMPWYNSWQGYSDLRMNRYAENQIMSMHCDHIHTLFDGKRRGIPVMTILAGLNDDYEGGEFIMFGDTEIKFGKGDVIIFPSNFLYPHKVNPVTKGVRYSCVSWAW